MVDEYRTRMYEPLAEAHDALRGDRYMAAHARLARSHRLRRALRRVRVVASAIHGLDVSQPGTVVARADIALDGLSPDDVLVEFVAGQETESLELEEIAVTELLPSDDSPAGAQRFSGRIDVPAPATFGYRVRVRPRNGDGAPSWHDPVVWG